MVKVKNIYGRSIVRILIHSTLWILVLLFFSFTFGADNTINSSVLSFSVFMMPVTIGTTYVAIYLLIPEYFLTKQYFKFGIYSFYCFVLSLFGILLSVFFAIAFLSDFQFTKVEALSRNALYVSTCIYLVVLVLSGIKLLKLNQQQSIYNEGLQTKILETQLLLKEQEVSYLKMQIHPHFLFNTLNTLYGFALKKSDLTPEMILKLSNLLDYLLYQIDKPKVALSEEINHIQDYISLEKMRFNETLQVDFQSSGCARDYSLAPMLFLPFVENSFKHGSIVNGALSVSISFVCDGPNIVFEMKNTYLEKDSNSHGIGLENIAKRLELLYPGNYDLTFSQDKNIYGVQLKLHIADV